MGYSDVECPYCDKWQEICHDDGQGYDQSMTNIQECNDCGEDFKFAADFIITYEAKKLED